MKRKIPAFTIMEITITMLISAIVIGLMYSAYQIMTRSYSSYYDKNNDMAAVTRLNELLAKDFSEALFAGSEENAVRLEKMNDTIQYHFDHDYIVRISTIIDTFKVVSDSLITRFEGMPINTAGVEDQWKQIDELQITILYKGQSFPFHFLKHYSSEELFKRDTDAVN